MAQGLRKIYGNCLTKKCLAVQSVSFIVAKGEVFSLLGVNGAGKTTTFKILTGEFPPTQGAAYIAGFNITTDIQKARRQVGYCPQFNAISGPLNCKEHLDLYARIKGIPKELIAAMTEKMLVAMDLKPFEKTLSENLSGGNKRKLNVAMALIGNPMIVFLDEPSAGMDPQARKFM